MWKWLATKLSHRQSETRTQSSASPAYVEYVTALYRAKASTHEPGPGPTPIHPALSSVFVSYSRSDSALVTPIVALLRCANASVFLDHDSIPLGKDWRFEICDSITSATLIYLFWSRAASHSAEVRAEYSLALKLAKRVVPVLLDETALPPQLEKLQSVVLNTRPHPVGTRHDRVLNAANLIMMDAVTYTVGIETDQTELRDVPTWDVFTKRLPEDALTMPVHVRVYFRAR
jgi:TIR domain-containing protein